MNRLTATDVPEQLNRNIATVMQEHSSGGKVHMYLFTAMEKLKNGRHFIHLPSCLFHYFLIWTTDEQVYAMPLSLLTFLTNSNPGTCALHPSGFSRFGIYYYSIPIPM